MQSYRHQTTHNYSRHWGDFPARDELDFQSCIEAAEPIVPSCKRATGWRSPTSPAFHGTGSLP